MVLTLNAENAAALLPNVAWLQGVASAEKSVSVKKFSNINEAFAHVSRKYQAQNYTPGGPVLGFPSLAELELRPWYRDIYHTNISTDTDNRFFVVISREAGHVGVFTQLEFLASVFMEAPFGTEAFEVSDLDAAVASIQAYVAENILPFSGYFPLEDFRMVRNLPLNQMAVLPYSAWMQANCLLPQGLQGFSVFGYAQPQLMPNGKPGLLPETGGIDVVAVEGGENDG